METITEKTTSLRQQEIVKDYYKHLNKHIEELKTGVALKTFEIKDLADIMNMHPRHLSNTIHEVLGKSPCDIYEQKLTDIAKELLMTTGQPIAEIARQLTYDPSNFTKFFKRYTGTTPKKFRAENRQI